MHWLLITLAKLLGWQLRKGVRLNKGIRKKIDLIVGARPNFIKAFPVYDELKNKGEFDLRLINTGQHYDKNMADIFFRQLKMKQPDIDLMIGSGSHAEQTGKIMMATEKVFIENKPDLVIVFGDVNSTIATAMSASKLHLPVAHVEAGLRSFDRSMPEEINRILTDQISDLLFITSPEAEVNLLKEGKNKDKIHFVGNTMIDSLIRFQPFFDSAHIKESYNLQDKEYILITLHRPFNVDDPANLERLVASLNKVAEIAPCIWPLHPRTRQQLKAIEPRVDDRLFIMDSLGYIEFMGLQQNASAVITDSGGVQEESTFLGIPCLTVRDNTERPITIEQGTNMLVGTDYSLIPEMVQETFEKNYDTTLPDLWDGDASNRIVKVIVKYLNTNK